MLRRLGDFVPDQRAKCTSPNHAVPENEQRAALKLGFGLYEWECMACGNRELFLVRHETTHENLLKSPHFLLMESLESGPSICDGDVELSQEVVDTLMGHDDD